jgi:hypothetical protein
VKHTVILVLGLVLIAGILAAGCSGSSNTSTGSKTVSTSSASPTSSGASTGSQTSSASMVEHKDTAQGYSIMTPAGWNVQVINHCYLKASDPQDKAHVTIQPLFFSGKYASRTAQQQAKSDLAVMKKSLQNFNVEDIQQSNDGSVVQAIVDYTYNGQKYKAAFITIISNGDGMLLSYDSPAGTFAASQPMLKNVLASFKQLNLQNSQSSAQQVKLTRVTPDIRLNPKYPQYPSFTGAYTMMLPAGWSAFQTQIDSCFADWVATKDSGYKVQAFRINQFRAFYDANKKDYDLKTVVYNQNAYGYYSAMPVVTDISPATAVKTLIPYWKGNYDNLENWQNLKIVKTLPLSQSFSGSNMGYYLVTYTQDGVPMEGELTVLVTQLQSSGMWFADVIGECAPASEFSQDKSLLETIAGSVQTTSQWNSYVAQYNKAEANSIAAVAKSQSETEDIIMSGYENREATLDRTNAYWDDTILGQDRVYDTDVGTQVQYEMPVLQASKMLNGNYNLAEVPIKDYVP